jgi:hypothetical protein
MPGEPKEVIRMLTEIKDDWQKGPFTRTLIVCMFGTGIAAFAALWLGFLHVRKFPPVDDGLLLPTLLAGALCVAFFITAAVASFFARRRGEI